MRFVYHNLDNKIGKKDEKEIYDNVNEWKKKVLMYEGFFSRLLV